MTKQPPKFAVLDLETTGLFARGTDRVIEIAALRLNEDGMVLNEYCSLVNPGRDIGPTRIHGIEAWEVADAPTMADILGDIATQLSDTVIVAHNATFDLGFLSAEFARSGNPLPPVPYVCTLEIAASMDGDFPSRKLEALCEYFDVLLPRAHSAIDDARATAGLLRVFMGAGIRRDKRSVENLPLRTYPGTAVAWPAQRPSQRTCQRGQRRSPVERGADFLSKLVERLPHSSTGPSNVQEYLGLLDQVVEDRRITEDESGRLFDVAVDLGLSRDQATAAHSGYVQSLVSAALEDQLLSDFELRDLTAVSKLLSVSDDALQSMIQAARTQAPKLLSKVSANATADNVRGCLICFTGDLNARLNGEPIDREFAERTAGERGMIVKNGVSRKLDFLVAADPDSNSGKAKKAREYGTRIISEAQFWRMVGVQVE